MTNQEIISKLPYSKPFLFVDELLHIKGHFKDNPITPGVILTEVMAQIGLVCLGIYILNNTFNKNTAIVLTSTEIDFLKPVFPNEKVTVISEKLYFRFGKLKCKVTMKNEKGETVCSGTIAGIILTPTLSKGEGATIE